MIDADKWLCISGTPVLRANANIKTAGNEPLNLPIGIPDLGHVKSVKMSCGVI